MRGLRAGGRKDFGSDAAMGLPASVVPGGAFGRLARLGGLLLLLLTPALHIVVFSLGGAMAAGADLVVALAVLLGLPHLMRTPLRLKAGTDRAFVLLLLFGLWSMGSGLWGFHPTYALAKGAGYSGLALAGWSLARSGLSSDEAIRGWLVGAGAALLLSLLLLLAGLLPWPPQAEWLFERGVYRGGAVEGLPLPRWRGPFLHPNLFGEYLLLSGILLWGVWPEVRRANPWVPRALAASLGVAMALAVPSALVAAGPLLALAAWESSCASAKAGEGRVRRLGLRLFALASAGMGGLVALALTLPLRVPLGPLLLESDGLRPVLWRSTLDAIWASPLIGVGASPYLATALAGEGRGVLWEAHSLYLGVFAQFGVVGLLLLGGGVFLLLLPLLRVGPPTTGENARLRWALLAGLAAVALHGFFSGSEDVRHAWLFLGIIGVFLHRREGRVAP